MERRLNYKNNIYITKRFRKKKKKKKIGPKGSQFGPRSVLSRCDTMVLGMKTNMLMTFDMLIQLIKKFTRSWIKLFVCLRIVGFFFFFNFFFTQMLESGRSIISIKMIISSDIDKQLRYCNNRF